MVASTRFRCSAQAEDTWGRLLSLYRWRRLKWEKKRKWGDPQRQGVDWGERALGIAPHQSEQDLGTEARILLLDTEAKLGLLEARGPSEHAGVALARRCLASQRRTDIRERYGLDYATAEELLEKVKEWIHWACSDDDNLEPELAWDE